MFGDTHHVSAVLHLTLEVHTGFGGSVFSNFGYPPKEHEFIKKKLSSPYTHMTGRHDRTLTNGHLPWRSPTANAGEPVFSRLLRLDDFLALRAAWRNEAPSSAPGAVTG